MWRQRVINCRSSGLTVTPWCEDNDVHYKLYCYWQRKVWDAELNSIAQKERVSDVPQIQFDETNLPVQTNETGMADIILRCGNWSLEIRNTASQELISQIVEQVARHV